MSVIDQHVARRPGQSAEPAPSIAGLRLAWEVLADSATVARLVGAPVARARLAIDLDHAHAHVFLETWARPDQHAPQRVALGAPAPVTVTGAGAADFFHIDVPGVLRATVTMAGENPRVLYARTPLLLSLGFPGGSYDRPEANWSRPA